jgi:hypothetical protein
MAGIRAALTLVCAAACVAASTVPAGATGTVARTPAEIELRKVAVEERLAAIEREQVAIDTLLAALPAAVAGPVEGAALERRRHDLAARRAALAVEAATLRKEQAELALARTRNATGPLQPADPAGLNASPSQSASGQVFNAALAVIPDIAYYNDDKNGDAFEIVNGADGFAEHSHDSVTDEPHREGALDRGFNLRETEFALSGAVEPYFDVWTTVELSVDAVEAEEVYVQTRKLLPGLQLRAGRFLSGVGYINRQHPHQWDFVDQALVYDAIFGGHLADTGLQVTWMPHAPGYALMGFEALQGTNGRISGQEAERFPDYFERTPGPRLFTGFLKAGPTPGRTRTVQGGASFGYSRSHQEAIVLRDMLEEGLSGSAWFAGTDWVWRHDSGRALGRGDFTVQGEYLYRKENLSRVAIDGVKIRGGSPHVFVQDGFYAQWVYGIAPRWTVAGRVDVIGLTNRFEALGGAIDFHGSARYSAAIAFNPTESSRLRVQYNAGDFWRQGRTRLNQVFVQFQMSLGVHGARTF